MKSERIYMIWYYDSIADAYYLVLNSIISHSSQYKFTLESITLESTDEIALKSQIEELKAENADLRKMIESFEQRLSALENVDLTTYALKSDIPPAVDLSEYVSNSALTTKLNSYATTSSLNTTNNRFANYTTTTD